MSLSKAFSEWLVVGVTTSTVHNIMVADHGEKLGGLTVLLPIVIFGGGGGGGGGDTCNSANSSHGYSSTNIR